MKIIIPGIVLIVLAIIIGPQALYTVDETQYVVVTRFGEVRRVETVPGLKFKVPVVDTANVLDSRLLRVDVPVASMPDAEEQFLDIDAYVRYRINDPRSFREVLQNEVTAASRISALVIAQLRAEIGQRTRSEIIGGLLTTRDDKDDPGRQEEVVQPRLSASGLPTREEIVEAVRDRANVDAANQSFGIEIIDVRVKRADFPDTTIESIYSEMRTERLVQANRLRAEGEEEFLTITADVNRQVEVIGAEAEETSSRTRGEGEAEAISILAEALEQDPDLFAFLRSLEAYREFLQDNSTLVLNAKNELFKYLQNPRP